MKARLFCRYDPRQRIVRLLRLVGGRGPWWQFTVALAPRLYQFVPQWDGWFLTVLGVRLHWRRSFGGVTAR